MEDLINRMIAFRGKHDLSQEKLAELCKLSTQTIWAVESGQQKPSKLTLAKIEEVLNNGFEHKQD